MMTSWVEARSGCDGQAIAAREADIIGKPQRIEPLPAGALSDEQVGMVNAVRGSIGSRVSDDIPDYFRTMVKHPELFRCQAEMGTAIFKGALPPRDRELAVLRNAWILRAPYEWGEHVAIAKRNGVSADEIARVIEGSTASGWSEHDRAVLRAVEELLEVQAISDETWATLARTWSEKQLIEFPMMVGQYVATAMVQNALRMRLGPSNPGLTNR